VAEIEGARCSIAFIADYQASGYNMALEEFMNWFQAGAPPGLHQGYGERLASVTRGARPWFVVYHHPHVGDSQAGRRGR